MIIQPENRNLVNGVLGTVAFHLLLLVMFLFLKLGDVKTEHKETIIIEFAEEEFKPIEQIIEENKPKDVEITPLSDQTIKNIAVNTADRLNEEISTEKYEQEIMKELGMEQIKQDLDRVDDEDIAIDEKEKPLEKEDIKRYTGKTRVEYSLGDRRHRYLHIPVYKCQGYGEVVINIIVNQDGDVIQASVQSTSTSEICLSETAIEAAQLSYFNSNLNAETRVKGTIKYSFVAQ